MANFDAFKETSLTDQLTNFVKLAAFDPPPQWTDVLVQEGTSPQLLVLRSTVNLTDRSAALVVVTARTMAALLAATPQDDWFERVIVLPGAIDVGIVLSTQVFTLDLFNAYRTQRRSLSAFVNNVGSGITLAGLPALPSNVNALSSLVLTLSVLADGPPQIAGTLDFVFDDRTAKVSLLGQRAILLAVEPVLPIVETLLFRTDVITKQDGREQRVSLRASPRASYDVTYELESFDRQFLEARVFAGQERAYGLPLWHEPSLLTAAVGIGNTTITVDSTAYADFRDGGLAIVFSGADSFEALQILSHTGTTLSFTSAFTKAFQIGTRVLPVRSVRLAQTSRGAKYQRNLQRTNVRATAIDAGVDISSAAAFSSFSGRPLIDDGNVIEGTIGESTDQRTFILDSLMGRFAVASDEPVVRRGSMKTFVSQTRQRLWEMRQLFHYLRGRTGSFYLPTFFDEFVVTANVTAAGTTLNFRNFGFTKFVKAHAPRAAVRLVLLNGTRVSRAINSAAEVDATTEQIVVSSAWGVDATPAEIDRVDFIERTRLDTDEVQIRHQSCLGDAIMAVPVKAVLE